MVIASVINIVLDVWFVMGLSWGVAGAAAVRESTATATPVADNERATMQAALAFRIADEWLALPVPALRQVDEPRPIQPLPHRRNGVVLGLVNVRGTLMIAASLGDMLNLDRAGTGRHTLRQGQARMLVAEHRGETAVLPVDEVEGVIRFAADTLIPAPTTLTHSAAAHTHGVFEWRGTTVGLLDPDRLFESLARSLR
ncbi:MAG: chemotaxis protein CheW [Burkholderia sp.]|nr:chemotaxis protein CheW [Burkholderia sp.]